MPLRARRRGRFFDVPVQDMVLRVAGSEDLYEEVRATGLQFWEQIQSYAVRHPGFQQSRRPVTVTEEAPAVVRQMARLAATAGVGPMFTFPGALTEYVGQSLAQNMAEVNVSCGSDHFVITRNRARLPVHARPASGELAVVIKPELGPHGIYTSPGGSPFLGEWPDGIVVVARSCILADAAAAAARAILAKPKSFRAALGFLQRLPGVHGAIVVRGEHIGLAGGLELAA